MAGKKSNVEQKQDLQGVVPAKTGNGGILYDRRRKAWCCPKCAPSLKKSGKLVAILEDGQPVEQAAKLTPVQDLDRFRLKCGRCGWISKEVSRPAALVFKPGTQTTCPWCGEKGEVASTQEKIRYTRCKADRSHRWKAVEEDPAEPKEAG